MKSKLPPYNMNRVIRHFSARGVSMGEVSEIYQLFGPQLENYRLRLYELYNQKADLLSKRESLRFMYLGNWAAEFKSGLNRFASNLMASENSTILSFFQVYSIMGSLFFTVPLLTLDSKQTWYKVLGTTINFSPGNVLGYRESGTVISFLSPSELFLAQYDPTSSDQSNIYDKYEGTFTQFNWVRSASEFMNNLLDASGMPVSPQNIKPYFEYLLEGNRVGEPSQRREFVQIITDAYADADLPAILAKGKILYQDLLKETAMLAQNYYAIKNEEADIKNFVQSYIAMDENLTNLTVSDIFNELMDFSKIYQAHQIMTATPPSTTQAQPSTVPGTNVPAQPGAAQPAKSNKALWVAAAAAAAGLFFLS